MLQLRLSVIFFFFFASKSDIYSCCFNPAIFSELHEFSFECLFFVHEYCHMMSCELFLIGLP